MRAPTRNTLREAWEEWERLAREGVVRNRSGDPYKPAALRGYEKSMRLRVLPQLGGSRVGQITRNDLQDPLDGLTPRG